jgi:hypothetical protein
MNKITAADQLPVVMPATAAGRSALPGAFPFEALDDRIAIVGTAGSSNSCSTAARG